MKIFILVLATVLVDVLIVIGMLNRVENIFIFFAYVCVIIPFVMIGVLITEIKRKSAI